MRTRPASIVRPLLLVLGLTLCASPTALGRAADAPAPDGQKLYETKCAACHGKDGVAKKMGEGSANLNDPTWQEATTPEAIATVILEGKSESKVKMPPAKGKLTTEEINAIAAYVKTLAK